MGDVRLTGHFTLDDIPIAALGLLGTRGQSVRQLAMLQLLSYEILTAHSYVS